MGPGVLFIINLENTQKRFLLRVLFKSRTLSQYPTGYTVFCE